jgi:hypothetical protein
MTEPFVTGRETIARAESFIDSLPLNGTLVPLSKKIAGKGLSLMARHITSPFTALGEYAPSNQYESFLLLNIFGTDVKGSENVGFIDWAVQNRDATCRNIQMYITTPQNRHEELAAEVFGFPFMVDGFMVEEGYERNGVGSFLAALSLATLPRIGASRIMPPVGYATDNAQSLWKKFGRETGTHPVQPFSLTGAATYPQVVRNIAEFA